MGSMSIDGVKHFARVTHRNFSTLQKNNASARPSSIINCRSPADAIIIFMNFSSYTPQLLHLPILTPMDLNYYPAVLR